MQQTIIALRHGEVDNPGNVIYARLPGFELSERGLEGARRMGERCTTAPVAAVYSSPLERAQQTAAELAGPHGLPVITDERLLEWSFWTRWQGTPWLTVREQAPDVFRAYADDPASLCPEEPLAVVGERMLSWVAEVHVAHPQGLVLAVSHEAPLVAAYLVASGRPIADFSAVTIPHLLGVRLEPAPADIVDPATVFK